jgi:hypothetical protein
MSLPRAMFGVLASVGTVALSGCSQFNMVPSCDSVARGVALALIPNSLVPPGGQIDQARVLSIVSVTDLREVTSAYNSRTCRGVIALSDGSARFEATFRLDQAEGARSWQEIQFLDRGNPRFDGLVAGVQQAYAAGGR